MRSMISTKLFLCGVTTSIFWSASVVSSFGQTAQDPEQLRAAIEQELASFEAHVSAVRGSC